jgi:chromosome segregation ATPase
MGRGIQQSEVDDAADTLLLRGERPTIERIRAELGTGSPATVNRMLDVWWNGLGQRLAHSKAAMALPDAPTELVQALSAVWEAALTKGREALEKEYASAKSGLEDLRQRLSLEAAAAESAKQDADADRDRAIHELQSTKALLQQAMTTLETHRLRIDQLTDQVSRLTTVNERLQAEVTENANRERRLLAEAQQERATLETAHRAAQDRWMLELDRSRQNEKALNAQLRAAQAETGRIRKEAAAAENKLKETVYTLATRVAPSNQVSAKRAARTKTADVKPALAKRSRAKTPT